MKRRKSLTVTGCRSIQKPSTATWWTGCSSGKKSAEPIANVPSGTQDMFGCDMALLDRHGDLQALLVRDQVIVVVEACVELNPLHLAGEVAGLAQVLLADRGARVVADIAGLIGRVQHRDGCLDAALGNLIAIYVEGDRAALAKSAAVVIEFHAHLVLACWDG